MNKVKVEVILKLNYHLILFVFIQIYSRSCTAFIALPSSYVHSVRDWREALSSKLFYPAVGLKLEEFSGRLQIEHRLAKNEKFQD
ncbi:unnamed protein product [Rotaria sp. Silwood2]|nr:unnamed protein product [Rotaria sp. Silwood2]CAF2916641.1 unnamed protein product [Rotaria sp. Silwood2]CAF4047212.1 unnamed protein product [Rotaria sp. Silwood2]CAF4198927.1 unnamed protein product [Rotaria sp. Silwood2]CAF4639866.1 unnamed protein product [Rotaria sp. Silwood2]